MGLSSIAITLAFVGPALGGYQGDRLPITKTRSALSIKGEGSNPRCIGWLLGKLEYVGELSMTGMASWLDSSTRLLKPAGSLPADSVIIKGFVLDINMAESLSISSDEGWVLGAVGIWRIFCGGFQGWIIVSIGMSKKVGPRGTRCAISPALISCS